MHQIHPPASVQPNTSTGLLIGLGLRIIVDRLLFLNTGGSVFAQNLLLGVWQGVLLFYVVSAAPHIFLAVCGGVGARFVVDLFVIRDIAHSTRSLLGIPLGALLAGLCSFFWEDDLQGSEPRHSRRGRLSSKALAKRKHRNLIPPVQLDAISEEGSDLSSLARDHARDRARFARKDETNSEVAALRAQAAAAEGDRRRYQEERKWAISQGNWARASQLGWQIRKYEALRDSFEREAKQKALEAARKPTPDVRKSPRMGTSVPLPPGFTLQERHPRDPEITFETYEIPRSSSAPPSIYADLPKIHIEQPSTDENNLPTPPDSPSTPVDPTSPVIPTVPQPRSPRKTYDPKDAFQRRPRTTSTPSRPAPHFGHGPGYGLLNFISGTVSPRRNSFGSSSPRPRVPPIITTTTTTRTTNPTRPVTNILVPNYSGGTPDIILSHYRTDHRFER